MTDCFYALIYLYSLPINKRYRVQQCFINKLVATYRGFKFHFTLAFLFYSVRNLHYQPITKYILNISFQEIATYFCTFFSRGLSFSNFSLSLSLSLYISFFKILTHTKQPYGHVQVFVHMLSNFICMDNFVQKSVKNKFFCSPLHYLP